MPRHAESAPLALAAFSLSAWLLGACTATAPPPSPPPLAPVSSATPVPVATPEPAPPPPLAQVLAFADKLRPLGAAELEAELDALRARPGAIAWLRAALVHAHKQPPDLPRAIELSGQALADTSPEGEHLQALARLLATRFAQQRKLEEQLDRQGRQLAEVQRRLDQSLERLEALKAIERSLGRRVPPGAP